MIAFLVLPSITSLTGHSVHTTFPESENKKQKNVQKKPFRDVETKGGPMVKNLGLKKILALYFLKVFNFGFLCLKFIKDFLVKEDKNCHSKTCVRGWCSNIW